MKLLIVGAGGFIGSRLFQYFKNEGCNCLGIARQVGNQRPDLLSIDVTDIRKIDSAILTFQPDVVVNCAATGVSRSSAEDVDDLFAVNSIFPIKLFQICDALKIKRLVHLTSAFECGTAVDAITEDTAMSPVGIYGITKMAATRFLLQQQPESVKVTLLRFFNVWGYGEKSDRLAPSIVNSCQMNLELSLSSGKQVRDFIYINDALKGMMKVLSKEHSEPVALFNLSSGIARTVKDFALEISQALGGEHLMRFGQLTDGSKGMDRLACDMSKFNAFFGPIELMPTGDAIRDMINDLEKAENTVKKI